MRKFSVYSVAVLLLFAIAANAAANVVLSDQAFSTVGKNGHLLIQFQKPMGYISHSPINKGKTVVVKMRDLFPTAGTGNVNERLSVPAKQDSPVSEISYEQDSANNGALTIQFTREIDYTIEFSKDRKSISVLLKDIKAAEEIQTQAPDVSNDLPIYVINLQTSTTPINASNQPALVNFNAFDVYSDVDKKTGKTLHTLHLGYFYSLSLANANLDRLKPYYPAAWVGDIKPERRKAAENWFFNARLAQLKKQKVEKVQPGKSEALLERARKAMIEKDYDAAIRLFTRIQELGEPQYQQETLELLGLARERNGQLAHAKAEYEEYLRRYPEGEDAERVRQRLFGLTTARSVVKEKLADAPQTVEPEWVLFGSLFQFYNRQSVVVDNSPVTVTDSSIRTDIVYTGRKRGLEYDQRFNIAANNVYSLIHDTNKSENEVSSLYYEVNKRDGAYAFRVGRQAHTSDGVLGRFDGVIFTKATGTDQKVNLLAGYPVELSIDNALNTDRQLYGVSYDINALLPNTDFKFYYINQDNTGLTDRTAIGTEIKSITDSSSLLLLVDYDTFFSELNIATFVGTWRNEANSTLNFIADYRQNPALTSNNALIGQPVTTMAELKNLYSEDVIHQLAIDRTAVYKSLSVSAATALNDQYQVNGGVTWSSLDDTVASTAGSVPAQQGFDSDMYYNASLVATNFFSESDLTIFGIRYNDSETFNKTQLNFSSNFNLGSKWRINPRLVYESRDSSNSGTRTSWLPRLVANYRLSRTFKLELDTGYRVSDSNNPIDNSSSTEEDFYFYFGYIYDF